MRPCPSQSAPRRCRPGRRWPRARCRRRRSSASRSTPGRRSACPSPLGGSSSGGRVVGSHPARLLCTMPVGSETMNSFIARCVDLCVISASISTPSTGLRDGVRCGRHLGPAAVDSPLAPPPRARRPLPDRQQRGGRRKLRGPTSAPERESGRTKSLTSWRPSSRNSNIALSR